MADSSSSRKPEGIELTQISSSSSRPADTELAETSSSNQRARTFENLELSQFKVVSDFSDHLMMSRPKTRPNDKKVRDDWEHIKAFIKPGSYVRAHKSRLDLLRVMIVGPLGTPYCNCPVFYDFHIPRKFPYAPPTVLDFYLLTNPGTQRHNWRHILNRINNKPPQNYTREEEEEEEETTDEITMAEDQSIMLMLEYLEKCVLQGKQGPDSRMKNAKEFMKACTQMVKALRNPPQHFEDIVYNHFHLRGKSILDAFKAYSTGLLEVGHYKEDDRGKQIVSEDSESVAVRRFFEDSDNVRKWIELKAAIERNEAEGPKKYKVSQAVSEVHRLNLHTRYSGLTVGPNTTASSSRAAGTSTAEAGRRVVGSNQAIASISTEERNPRISTSLLGRLNNCCLSLIGCGIAVVEDDLEEGEAFIQKRE